MKLNPTIQTLIATLFTWFVTLLGAAFVFIFKIINKSIMDSLLGFSAGIMIAASFFSLLAPAIDISKSLNMLSWLVITIGFLAGSFILIIIDKFFNLHFQNGTNLKRSFMLILSITLHNIPEGLAIGVAFGSIIYNIEGATFASACILSLGIGIQNLPEGSAVSLPLRRDGFSRKKAFFYGQLSAVVEPISGIVGAFLVLKVRYLLPFLLSFASGAMIYVVVQELIPESQTNNNKSLVTFFTLLGFALMMILDVALS